MAAIIAARGIGAASARPAPGFICFTAAGGSTTTNRLAAPRRGKASINCGQHFATEE
jgi:hypothetical protein